MSDPKHHLRLVRLTAPQRAELFRRLERQAAAASAARPAHSERRRERRWEYRRDDVWLTVEHPGGGTARFIVLARNLSAGGMAFIHGGFVHATTRCSLQLHRVDGAECEVRGQVIESRHLEGALHEVRLRFEEPIEPSDFIGFGDTAVVPIDEADLSDLHGRVLYLQDADVHAYLLARHLSATNITLVRVTAEAEALEAARSGEFEAILVDLNVDGSEGTGVIRGLREQGFEGPIVLLTPETDDARVAALSAGANHVLRKPYRPEHLYLLLIRLHLQRTGSDVLYSSMEARADACSMLQQYIDHARDVADRLDSALGEQDLARLRVECLGLKGSAAGYGFEPLSTAAEAAVRLLDQSGPEELTVGRIRRVAAMCRRLAIRELGKSER